LTCRTRSPSIRSVVRPPDRDSPCSEPGAPAVPEDAAYRLALAYVETTVRLDPGRFSGEAIQALNHVLESLSESDAMLIESARRQRRPALTRAAAVLLAMRLRRAEL
jgi:hypothetical protein